MKALERYRVVGGNGCWEQKVAAVIERSARRKWRGHVKAAEIAGLVGRTYSGRVQLPRDGFAGCGRCVRGVWSVKVVD